jgi:hypothetical protein
MLAGRGNSEEIVHMANNVGCPICSALAEVLTTPFTKYNLARVSRFQCPDCNTFDVFEQNVSQVAGLIKQLAGEKAWAPRLVSYWVRRAQRTDDPPLIRIDLVKQIVSEQRLPGIEEQASNLLRFLGQELQIRQDPSGEVQFDPGKVVSLVGSLDRSGIWYLADELESAGLLAFLPALPGNAAPLRPSERFQNIKTVRLTFYGWERYAELQKAHAEGPIAFMAMPFGNDDLTRVFSECFKPAVAQTGFELRRVIDRPKAGLIDDRLRVEIRKARFIICELTENNAGAYWEGGFAEGLGRPVIYTCEQQFFDDKRTHFDTNHCHTIKWSLADLPDAAARLKATIRTTLPGEAKLTDS